MNELKRIRISKKLTQEELSIQAQVSLKQIKKYETNIESLCRCKVTTAKKIARALDCEPEKLLPYEEIIKLEQEQKNKPIGH